jgi:hypothetical protein
MMAALQADVSAMNIPGRSGDLPAAFSLTLYYRRPSS